MVLVCLVLQSILSQHLGNGRSLQLLNFDHGYHSSFVRYLISNAPTVAYWMPVVMQYVFKPVCNVIPKSAPGTPCLRWHIPGPLQNPQLLSVENEKCLNSDASICCAFIYGLCNVPCKKDRAGSSCTGYFFKSRQNGAITNTQTLWRFIYSALKCLPLNKQVCRSMSVTFSFVLLCFPGNLMKENQFIVFCCLCVYRASSVPKGKVLKVRKNARVRSEGLNSQLDQIDQIPTAVFILL